MGQTNREKTAEVTLLGKTDFSDAEKALSLALERDGRLCLPKSAVSKPQLVTQRRRYIVSSARQLFTTAVLIVLIIFGSSGSSAHANVVPSAPSDVVSHPANLVTTSTACGTDAEVEFIGLTVPTGQVLMITGFYFSASSTIGSDTVESELYVTNGNNSDRRFVAPLSGISGASGLYSGLNSFPVPVPSLRGKYTHLCWVHITGTLNTSATPWLFGFFAPND